MAADDRVTLLALTAALGGVVWLEMTHGLFAPAPLAAPASPTVVEAPLPAVTDAAPPEPPTRRRWGGFEETIERPLFRPDRRPPAPPIPAAVAAPGPSEAALRAHRVVGVVRIGAADFALVRGPDGAETRPVSLGDRVAGWQVVEIRRDRIAFGDGERRVELALTPTSERP